MEPLTQYSQSKDTDVDTYELEARFGNQLTKLDYNHVIQWLLLSGFTLEDATGKDILRIGYKKTTENIRIEINGIKAIQRYCKTQQLVNPTFGKKKQVPLARLQSPHRLTNRRRSSDRVVPWKWHSPDFGKKWERIELRDPVQKRPA
jgi:hypothetical protein